MARKAGGPEDALSPLAVEAIVTYIEHCRTPDGGYFFARVPPASARDTYHALESLRILGSEPGHKEALGAWVREATLGSLDGQLYDLFYLTKAAVALGLELDWLRARAERVAVPWLAGRRPVGRVYVEVPSELEAPWMALEVCLDLGLEVDRAQLVDFILSLRNGDGGFGHEGRSTLSSTYFATVALARAGAEGWPAHRTVAWLKRREKEGNLQFLEHWFWLSGALKALGSRMQRCDEAASFALACQRPSGGFGRAPRGIATLEDTHRALVVLKEAGRLA